MFDIHVNKKERKIEQTKENRKKEQKFLPFRYLAFVQNSHFPWLQPFSTRLGSISPRSMSSYARSRSSDVSFKAEVKSSRILGISISPVSAPVRKMNIEYSFYNDYWS